MSEKTSDLVANAFRSLNEKNKSLKNKNKNERLKADAERSKEALTDEIHELLDEIYELREKNQLLKEESEYDQRNAAMSQKESVALLAENERLAREVQHYKNIAFNAHEDAERWRNRIHWLNDVMMEAIGDWGGDNHECFNLAIKLIRKEAAGGSDDPK